MRDWSGWTREIARLRRRSERWRRLADERGRSRDMWKARAIGAELEIRRLQRELKCLRRRRLPETAAAQFARRVKQS